MTICNNCLNNFDTNYCPNCGTAAKIKRIDKHYVWHEVQHGILHLEKGFLFTVKELFTNPGHSIRKFIQGNRLKYYKPIGYVIICSIVYSLISHQLHHEVAMAIKKGNVSKIFEWITDHYNYSNLIEILFIALTLKWFFRRENYNYFENLVLLCYLTGFAMLIGGLCIIVAHIFKLEVINSVIFPLAMLLYTIWAIAQFYSSNHWQTYLKALVAYITGFFLFVISAVLLGEILDGVNIHL